MSSSSCSSLRSLRAAIESLPGRLPTPLVPYVILPLRTTIKKVANSDVSVLEEALSTAAVILSRSSGLDRWEWFQDLFSFLCLLLDNKLAGEAGLVGCGSEGVLHAGLTLLTALFLSHTSSIQKRVYTEPVSVGHCISVLLNHASDPVSSHSLAVASLSALCALAGLDIIPLLHKADQLQATPPGSDHFLSAVSGYMEGVRRVGVGEPFMAAVLRSFLPGLCSSITRLVASSNTTTSLVISHGLITWAHYVGVVMSGEATPSQSTPSLVPASSYLPEKQLSEETLERCTLLVERDGQWERATAARLQVLVQRITVLVTNDVWKTRLHLAGWGHTLITHTHKVLEVCVPHWLEVLVTLSHDGYPHVSTTARMALKHFPAGSHTLSSLLGTQLHTLVSSLPRLIRHHDDVRKVATLQLLAGYLQLAGSHVTLMIHSLSHLTRLVQALLEALTLETRVQGILATPLPDLVPTSLTPYALHLPHAHFHSDKVAALLKEVCHLLGCRGDFPVLLDCLLEQFRGSSQHHSELLLLMAYLLPGSCHSNCDHGEATPTKLSKEELYYLVEGLVSVIVEAEVWSSQVNSDLRRYLLVFTVYTCVHVVGTACDQLLQIILYPLMLRLQDSNVGVASAAMTTLDAICHHCQYSSVADLIGQNADYLIHKISEQLRTRRAGLHSHQYHPQAIQVLQSVVSHGNEEVCLLVKDVLDELLLSLDLQQLEAELVWEGLDVVTCNCARWVDQRHIVSESERTADTEEGTASSEDAGDVGRAQDNEEDRKGVGLEAIGKYFMNYHKEKAKREEEELGGDGCGGEEVSEGLHPDDQKLPCCEEVCVEVLRRSVHHMSHPVAMVRLKVLAAVQHCLRSLRHHKMSLYPEVHLVWSPLLPRLSDHAHPVAREAWQVIGSMSEVAGDFLRKRVLEKVWPLLIHTLDTMATSSLKADHLYKQSAKCKLQLSLLKCVGQLCLSLSLPSIPWEGGAVGVVLYLHDDQPVILQEAALDVSKELISVDGDKMWLLLSQLSPGTHPQTTPPGLKPYKFSVYPEAEKYFKNAQKLLPLTFSS